MISASTVTVQFCQLNQFLWLMQIWHFECFGSHLCYLILCRFNDCIGWYYIHFFYPKIKESTLDEIRISFKTIDIVTSKGSWEIYTRHSEWVCKHSCALNVVRIQYWGVSVTSVWNTCLPQPKLLNITKQRLLKKVALLNWLEMNEYGWVWTVQVILRLHLDIWYK